jgi:3-oxoacyl-[acyl-carrier-protein] synthase-3
MSNIRSVIIGSGKYLPTNSRPNSYFENSTFYNADGSLFPATSSEIVEKFYAITGIKERKVLDDDLMCSDMGAMAAEMAINDAGIDRETIDQIIVAHNFGDLNTKNVVPDMMPSLGSRVKHKLGIKNEECVAYDLIFGCPGWVQAMIQADVFIKSGYAKTCLVVGAESLERATDRFDRDSMIFADGAGAVVVTRKDSDQEIGIINHATLTHAADELTYLNMGTSFNQPNENEKYIKMNGRKIYNYALTHVPKAIKSCLDKSGLHLNDVSKILIHQANEKMDVAIGERLFSLYGIEHMPQDKMPMNISKTGNSSVATIPTLYDMIMKGELPPYDIVSGDVLVMASVGAGMNINALTYRVP